MRPDISEFSYGYALTEELATVHKTYLTAAPVFPSLRAEGKPGQGWDVRLETVGVPAFLQFKVGHPVLTRNAVEFKKNAFPLPPYGSATPLHYRMHLRAPRHSHQHESLRLLEQQGHFVRYVAPAFHGPTGLNEAYLDGKVAERSFWLRPLDIILPDDKEHHVSYVGPSGPHCVCSPEPYTLDIDGTFDRFISDVTGVAQRRRSLDMRFDAMFMRLGDDLTAIIESRSFSPRSKRRTTSLDRGGAGGINLQAPINESVQRIQTALARTRDELPPAGRAAYLARTYFDAELLVVGPPES